MALPTGAQSLRPALPNLLLSNLRLLQLDRLDDWPNITLKTYTTKDGQSANQKHRIQATEWILYRLFELWDPSQTQYVSLAPISRDYPDIMQKLQPYFPSLEPLQSKKLRIALHGMLNESGLFKTALRKSLLDDCKGDKILEVLVIFSTAVVKKTVVQKSPNNPVSLKLATMPVLFHFQSPTKALYDRCFVRKEKRTHVASGFPNSSTKRWNNFPSACLSVLEIEEHPYPKPIQ
jgi:HAUS augmin-like complex subunit 6 N-terminus